MKILRKIYIFLFLSVLLAFTGCDNKMGYFLVAWPEDFSVMGCADLFPIKSESHLRKTHILNLGNNKYAEIASFRGFVFRTLQEAKAAQSELWEYKDLFAYAEAKTPVRETADVQSSRVYILREGQVVKIISRGKDKVQLGERLSGYWYKIITDDGIIGYCFDRNLTIYMDDGKGNSTRTVDITMFTDRFFGSQWYPVEYREEMEEDYPDLAILRDGRCLWGNPDKKEVYLRDGKKEIRFKFTEVKQQSHNRIIFIGSSVDVTFYPDGRLFVRYSDDGVDRSEFFTTLDTPLQDYIAEQNRQKSNEYNLLLQRVQYYESLENGRLQFDSDGNFIWTDRYDAVADFIPPANGDRGIVDNHRYVSEKLKKARGYDGVITMTFSRTAKEMSFIFKRLTNGDLQLIYIPEDSFKGLVLTRVPDNTRLFVFHPVSEVDR
ncbi:MAG: SH3 domain-containing protein [Spirochaetia bacterium]|nr:SH3 domain-containing protein [Spirochaetia bacterium]